MSDGLIAKHRTGGRERRIKPVIAGVGLGVVGLLLALVNDMWVVVRLPALPWSSPSAGFAFEARLWAVMLVSFVVGLLSAWVFLRRVRHISNGKRESERQELQRMETELERVTKLLALTQQQK